VLSTKNFSQLFIARMFIGTGEGGYASASGPIVHCLLPGKTAGHYPGNIEFRAFIGGIIGVMVGGYIAVHYGWRYAFGIVGLPGFLISIGFFLFGIIRP